MLRLEDLTSFNCELPHQTSADFYAELLKTPPTQNDITNFYLGWIKFQMDAMALIFKLWK